MLHDFLLFSRFTISFSFRPRFFMHFDTTLILSNPITFQLTCGFSWVFPSADLISTRMRDFDGSFFYWTVKEVSRQLMKFKDDTYKFWPCCVHVLESWCVWHVSTSHVWTFLFSLFFFSFEYLVWMIPTNPRSKK